MVKKIVVIMSVCLLGIALSGCGQQGPLYLPDKNAPDNNKTRTELNSGY